MIIFRVGPGSINIIMWLRNVNEHLGLPGCNKTLRADVFDGGVLGATHGAIISEPNKMLPM